MAKIYGQLERASLENLSADPTLGVTGRVWWNTTSLLVKTDDGTNIRALLRNDAKAIVGNNGTANNNIRLHRGANGVLQFVQGGDATAEGTPSTALNQISARLENYATAGLPATGNAGRTVFNTDLLTLQVDNGAAIKTLVLTDLAQILTNKDIDGGVASNSRRITLPGDTKTNLDGLTRKAGTVVYGSDTQKAYLDNGSILSPIGSGSGSGINYIPNPDFEVDASGWVAYADAAGTAPVDGTGGSPTTTITRSTSSPLRSVASGLITKDAANRQGEGVSANFTIDSADKATQLQISIDYLASAGFVAGDLSDITIWIYDVTNAVLIQPTPFTIQTGAGFQGHLKTSFQAASNSVSYRLIMHIGTTNASAWTLKFDNIVVGPMVSVLVSPLTDFAPATLTPGSGFGTVSGNIWWSKRIGDSIHVYGYFLSGTVTGAAGAIALPAGLQIDVAKIPVTNGTIQIGTWECAQSSLSSFSGTNSMGPVTINSADLTSVYLTWRGTGGVAQFDGVNSFIGSSGGVLINFIVPILGWGTNTVLSSDTSSRVVAAKANKSATQSIANSSQVKVTWDAKDYDTLNALDIATNNRFVAPVQGKYHTSGTITWAGSGAGDRYIYLFKNGSQVATLVDAGGKASGNFMTFATSVNLLAGDYIEIFVLQNSGGALNIGDGTSGDVTWAVERIAGPETIIPNETVAISYRSTSVATIGISGSGPVPYNVKDYDTHGAFVTDTFTAPIPGKYGIKAAFIVGGGSPTIRIYKNNTFYAQGTLGSSTNACVISKDIQLLAGDTIKIRPDVDSFTLAGTQEATYLDIIRIGN